MDCLLTLTSDKSEFTQQYFPPISLDVNGTYALGLYSLSTYNSIPNVVAGKNNRFEFLVSNEDNLRTFTRCVAQLPEGTYEIDKIGEMMYEAALEQHKQVLGVRYMEDAVAFEINLDNNTQKVEIKSSFMIDFSGSNHIGAILGFTNVRILRNVPTRSNSLVKISDIDIVNIECNIVEGSYNGGERSHTLYSFYPNDVPPGYKINIRPLNMLYLPITTRQISTISLRLVNQDGRIVNFRGENILVQLNLRKIN